MSFDFPSFPVTDDRELTAATCQFWKAWDLGLLRESPPGSYIFDMWNAGRDGKPGLWHRIIYDPINSSYSAIPHGMAKSMIGKGALYAPDENPRYERQTRERMRAAS